MNPALFNQRKVYYAPVMKTPKELIFSQKKAFLTFQETETLKNSFIFVIFWAVTC